MHLSDWRKERNLSTLEVARMLGLTGDRDGSSVWNWETGRSRPDADVVHRLERLTDGAVTAADMHAVRLAWLKANRPEKFEIADFVERPVAEAAE